MVMFGKLNKLGKTCKGLIKSIFFYSILFAGFNFGASAQNTPPKLILFIVIDELDNDQLLLLQSSFSDKGLNRIAREGFRFMSAYSRDFSAYPGTRLTSILTGVNPSIHGVVGEQWIEKRSGSFSETASFDTSAIKSCIQNNMARTFADYLKSFYGPQSRVGAITIDAPWMLAGLGYNSDFYYAYNKSTGNFYDVFRAGKDSTWVNQFNIRYSTNGYLTRHWGPLNDITSYTEYRYMLPEKRLGFRSFFYGMNDGGINGFRYGKVAASPYANALMRDFVVAFLVNTQFGQDNIPDLLSISFTTKPFLNTNGVVITAEKEDMLLRLDGELGSLIDFLDIDLGRENYLIVLTSAANSGGDRSTHGLPGKNTGVFENQKIASLLNLYLMAIHGQGKWVMGIIDGVVYLNKPLIESKGLLVKDMQETASRFLLEVSGVSRAIPSHDLILENRYDQLISNNIFPMRSGDIYLTLLPGWHTSVSEQGTRQDGFPGQRSLPFMFFGWKTNKGAWFDKTDATHLIPLLLKSIGLTHQSAINVPEIRVFNEIISDF